MIERPRPLDRWSPALLAHIQALVQAVPSDPGHGAAALALQTRTPRARDVRCSGFVPIGAWLTDVPRLLEGDAGAGKTTALRAIAGELARAALAASAAVPVVIAASAIATTAADNAAHSFAEAFATATRVTVTEWRELLDRGEAVVLIDAADRVTGADRARLLAALAAALAAWPGLRYVIASRPGTSEDIRALGFRRTAIEPLDEEAAAAWVASTSPRAAAAITASPALTALCRTPRAAVQLATRLGQLDLPAPPETTLAVTAAHAGDPDVESKRLFGLLELLRLPDASLHSASVGWTDEPLVPLALGVLAGDAPERAGRWFDAILDRVTAATVVDRAGWLALAARAWLEVGATATPARRDRYRGMLVTVLEHLADIAPAENIAALEALGREGDPRLGASPRLLPIPGRPDVAVGRFPVTVAEYRAFVAAGGYHEPRWWGAGWAMRVEAGWTTPGRWPAQLRTPNRPVVNVSWYEARAYAAWLAAATARPLGLVSSAAWQMVATHPDGPYPWGAAEPAPDRLNFDQHVGRATPVGLYPRGASPGGHLDLAGNVWEWCGDRAGPTARVVRGAGWYSAGKYARADYHYGFDPANRFHDLGLRLGAESGTASEDD